MGIFATLFYALTLYITLLGIPKIITVLFHNLDFIIVKVCEFSVCLFVSENYAYLLSPHENVEGSLLLGRIAHANDAEPK